MSPSQSPSPASQSPGSRGSGQQPQRRPLIPVWIWWALLVALLVWNVYALFFAKGSPPSVALSYSDFLSEVRAGAVATVTIHGQNVHGTFTQAVTWPPPGAAATPAPGTATATPTLSASPQSGTPASYTRFTTVLPPFPDDQLLPLLEQRGVTVSAKASSSGPSWLLELGLNLLPLLLFVGVLVLMGRQLQSGQQSLFSFGSSRARKYDGEHPDVTFADVAGEEEAPAIVFVDELDAVGRQRGAGLGGGNDEREQTLNQLLVEMDGFDEQTNVIVIAAANRPDVLDPALLRPGRFDRQVTVGLPDRAGREAILRVHTRRLPSGKDADLASLARRTPGFSGADLANLANEAALAAARRGAGEVDARDFDEALDRIILGTQQAGLLDENERRLVAYHEGGHALVAKLTPGADPVGRVTIIPHGRALGVTQQLPEDDRHTYPRDYLLGRLVVMLGGRAAEELVFGQPTTGAESDLKEVTGLARRMVGQWGMSEELGPVAYSLGEDSPFLGRELAEPREYADATAAALDDALRGLIERAHQQAREVLEAHRPQLDALAAELIAHETVDGRQLDDLLAAHSPPDMAIGAGSRGAGS